MKAEPQKEHRWLQKLVGEWIYEHDCAPGEAAGKSTGSERVRSLGGLWVLCEGQGEMPGGGTANTLMTLGYDTQKKKFVGTWVGSMMTNLWVYEGELDASGGVLTLNTEGPAMDEKGPIAGKTARYRDVIEFKSDDHRVLTSRMLGEDGTWKEFMTANYRRKK